MLTLISCEIQVMMWRDVCALDENYQFSLFVPFLPVEFNHQNIPHNTCTETHTTSGTVFTSQEAIQEFKNYLTFDHLHFFNRAVGTDYFSALYYA